MVLPGRTEEAARDGEAIALGPVGDEDFDSFMAGSALEVTARAGGAPSEPSGSRGVDLPTGRTPEPAELAIDPVEVSITADYGAVPSAWYVTPAYAVRVHVRRRALRESVHRLERELARAEEERDELLAETLRGLRSRLESEDRYSRLLSRVREAEALAGGRAEEMRRASADYSARSDQLGRQKHELEATVAERRHVRQERAEVLGQREQDYRRAEAGLKRIEIEMRNARALMEQGGAPDLPGRLAALQQQFAQTEPEVAARRGETQAQAREVEQIDGELKRLERDQKRLEGEQRALDQRTGKELGTRSAAVTDAQSDERLAWADAARAVLALGDPGLFEPTTMTALRARDQAVHQVATELAKHVQALDSFDRTALRRGHRVTLWGLALVVLLLAIAKWW
jgi:hypothetical protein